MPIFVPKPIPLEAHHVRFEDIHVIDVDWPDWMDELQNTGNLTVHSQENCLKLLLETGVWVAVQPGQYILYRPDGTAFAATRDRLVADYNMQG